MSARMPQRSLRILVADDNEVLRKGICSLLQSQEGWTVCGQAVDGRDAVQKAMELKPDIILLDVSMPLLNGFEAARTIHSNLPTSKILVISEHDVKTLNGLPPQLGVVGYVMKSRIVADLIPGVEAASRVGTHTF